MTAGITIRGCRPDECATILDLWKDAEVIPSITDHNDVLVRLIRENGDMLLVAEQDNRLVGTVIAGWDGWRGNIYRLAVLSEYRHQGIGRALVQEAEYCLLVRGARRISILVAHEETLAISFWDALNDIGYERDPRIVRYVKSL